VAAQIPNDDALVNSSINLGQPFVTSSAHKPVAKTVITLAASLMPEGSAAAEATSKKRAGTKWFSFVH
jgi:MinD-like ATPase involved in chromosome partitioning or flagellar assembly